MLHVDGSMGEGGGQVLRSSLSLSAITGRAFRIDAIRAGRSKPGLLRQHLACVRAAAEICGARIEGAQLGSTSLVFEPGPIRAGSFAFAVGSAGSANLVLQTVLPILWHAQDVSEVAVEGGTHNDWSPPFPFLAACFAPVMARMGAPVDLALEAHGFYPAGGGRVRALVEPADWQPLHWLERGEVSLSAHAVVSGLPLKVGGRELVALDRALGTGRGKPHQVANPRGPGNACWLHARFPTGDAVFTGFGRKGVRAEEVAAEAIDAYTDWLGRDVPVCEHLADQLLLPIAFAGEGCFRTVEPSLHTRTNADVIAAFTGQRFAMTRETRGAWRVELTAGGE
ncbi:MAG: RNA 3'-terminal phosphate cyclase [Deltaproteobacteria bacterium]|nr:MAG: RNA 3'-terminal phosphate cyclase [Deltaproteobacteria bacterium]